MMSPGFTRSPTFTSGRWLMQVFWLERWNFDRRKMSTPGLAGSVSSVARTTMRLPSICSTIPVRRAITVAPLSRATTPSMPVPTSGASDFTSGTAWRCMLEPISARLASSFSRNGMSAAATDTTCLADTSM